MGLKEILQKGMIGGIVIYAISCTHAKKYLPPVKELCSVDQVYNEREGRCEYLFDELLPAEPYSMMMPTGQWSEP